MCGIAGYTTLGSREKTDPRFITPMLDAIAHRGPDDEGSAHFDQVVLGNRRLAIIDLNTGRQPIGNEDGSVVVVYNGELYNYPELRLELKRKGHRFQTASDTEVLVHLYEEEGLDFLKRLNGMFALALYDIRQQKLILARDRFGVKPLFYTRQDNSLVFASEIKSLRTMPGFRAELDPEAIAVYLGLFYIPDPWTIYRHVRRLPAGHYIEITADGSRMDRYYDLDFSRKIDIDPDEAEDELARLVRQAVKRQLISDVPVGVLLSAGLDSRSILAASSEYEGSVTSFTIAFDEDIYDESKQAAVFARMFNSPHKRMVFREDDFANLLKGRQDHLDEPFAPWSNVAMEGMARYIHEHDFKVVLSGAGGDELFLGYPTVHAANIARYYRILPEGIRRRVITPLVRKLPAGSSRLPLTFMLKSFVEADHNNPFRNFFSFKEVLRRNMWDQLLTPEALKLVGPYDAFAAFEQYLPQIQDIHLVDALSYLDFRVFLQGCIFFAQDNAYMSASVEQRVPFMDNDLVEFACRLPIDIKFHPLKLKILLKRALEKHFPPPPEFKDQIKRYRKSGFEVPGNIWIHRPRVGNLIGDILSDSRLKKTGFFRPQAIRKLWDEHLAKSQNNERILQAVGSLVLFLDKN